MKNEVVGNNGNRLIDVLHINELLRDGMSADDIVVIANPFMVNPNHLFNDDLWDDAFYRAEELGYNLKY